MCCIEMVPQALFAVLLTFTRVMRASSNTLIKLAINMLFDVLEIVARIFHLDKIALCYAVWTPTRRCKNTLRGYRTIDDVWTSRVLFAVFVPV